MLIQITDEDTDHIFDIGLTVDNPIYAGCTLVAEKSTSSGLQLCLDHAAIRTQVFENIRAALDLRPKDYIIITGVAPTWVKLQATILASAHTNTIISYDGKNAYIVGVPKIS